MRKWLVWAVVGLIILLGIVGGLSAFQSHLQTGKIKKTADTFVADLLGDDTEGSYALFTTSTQKTTPQAAWGAEVDKLSSFFKDQSAHYQSTHQTAQLQFLTYVISGDDGNYKLSVTLSRQANEWRVQSFSSQLQ